MDNEFHVVIEEGEDGYLISEVVELPGCHTQGRNLDELIARTKEAILLYLECEPTIAAEPRFVGVQRVRV